MASSSSHHHHHHALVLETTITIFFLLQITLFPPATSLSFNFQGFNISDVNLQGEALLPPNPPSEIQITANRRDEANKYSVGRVTSNQLLRLWDKNSTNLTDFSTSFSFIVFSDQESFGDGLAFFLADPSLPLLTAISQGGGLGLVDGNGDQVPRSTQRSNSFVAVEFDTFSNPKWDPPGVHVGINVNSMRSVITRAWSPDIAVRKSYNCTVEYNSSTLTLTVSFTGNNRETSFAYLIDLRNHLPETVMIGFSAATGNLFEVHILQSWSFNSSLPDTADPVITEPSLPELQNDNNDHRRRDDEKKKKVWLLVGVGSCVGFALSFLVFMSVFCWKKMITARRRKEEQVVYDIQNMDEEFTEGSGPRRFRYSNLVAATSNFCESKKLGQGGFGGVYKGYLKDANSQVAIKRISKDSTQGIKEYATEVKIISQLRHRNLVQLLGWCHKKNDLLLVYEFMPNGSLDSHLYNNNNGLLTWQVRYKIALDLASALLYLHEEWSQCVLHRDIKSSNVMLDSSFNAKLGDFGLARLVSHEKGARTTLIAGTRGYIAPEYVFTGKAYKESDIYSLGVVLLEMASGRRAVEGEMVISVVEWVWELYGMGKVGEAADGRLCGEYDEKEMERMLVIGLWCTYPEHTMRPSAKEVIRVLSFEGELPDIPMTMPVPIYLPPSVKALFSSLSPSFWAKYSVFCHNLSPPAQMQTLCLLVVTYSVRDLYRRFLCIFLGFLLMDFSSTLKFLTQISEIGCGFFLLGCFSPVFNALCMVLVFGFCMKILHFGWHSEGFIRYLFDFGGKPRNPFSLGKNCVGDEFESDSVSFKCRIPLKSSRIPNSPNKNSLSVGEENENSNGDTNSVDLSEEKADVSTDTDREVRDEDEVFDVMSLRKLVKIERERANSAYAELEKERTASASAADEAMAMIFRLQSEKSSVEIQANQYRRMVEQKQEYDQDVIESLRWIITKQEDQLRMYREKLKQHMREDEIDELDKTNENRGFLNMCLEDDPDDSGSLFSSLEMDSQTHTTLEKDCTAMSRARKDVTPVGFMKTKCCCWNLMLSHEVIIHFLQSSSVISLIQAKRLMNDLNQEN
ncbi:L-type lectin-domain containing receptor kinase IX.1-like [Senna tora]|uniref:non-specific serine/threonine protein kinase n=1 Tax=Senna tora TaxID=362788 RepID=A0A834SHP6_9FABA|nr:L-type lectin-domain containing receptor kinase IX.1-like [Senna tora]